MPPNLLDEVKVEPEPGAKDPLKVSLDKFDFNRDYDFGLSMSVHGGGLVFFFFF